MADGFKRQKIKCRWRWKMGKLYWVRLMGGIAGYYCSSIGLICRFKKRSLKTGKQMSSNELSSRKIAVFTALSCFRPIEHPLERISWSLWALKHFALIANPHRLFPFVDPSAPETDESESIFSRANRFYWGFVGPFFRHSELAHSQRRCDGLVSFPLWGWAFVYVNPNAGHRRAKN